MSFFLVDYGFRFDQYKNSYMVKELIIQRGCAYTRTIKVYDKTVTPRVALNITGITLLFTIKRIDDKAINDLGAIVKKLISEHTDAVNGTTIIGLTASETNIAAGIYKADIKIMPGDINTSVFSIKIMDVVTTRKS